MRTVQFAILAACGAFLAAPAFAQSGTHAANSSGTNAVSGQSASGQSNNEWSNSGNNNLRQTLKQDLQKAGFTNINIEPEAFIVHAKNSEGQPVLMRIGPDSMQAVTALTPTQGQNQQQADNSSTSQSGGTKQQ